MRRLASAFGVAVGLTAGAAQAMPYTLYFDYTTTSFYDYNLGASVPGNVGLSYSGWLTFDLDNGTTSSFDDVNSQYQQTYAAGGCVRIENDACVINVPTALPVVTAYAFETPVGSFGRWIGGAPAPYDSSLRQNFDSLSSSGGDSNDWRVESYQVQQTITGTLTGPGYDYIFQSTQRFMSLTPSTFPFDAPNPFTAYNQLAEAPTVLPAGQQNVFFSDYGDSYRYTESGSTFLGSRPGSFYITATLTSARLEAGEAQVPLPGTLALLGVGLIGLAAARRQRS